MTPNIVVYCNINEYMQLVKLQSWLWLRFYV